MADRGAGKGDALRALSWLVGVLGFVVLPYKFLVIDWFARGLGVALGGRVNEAESSAAAAGPVLALVSVVGTVFVLLALNRPQRSLDSDVPRAPGSGPVVLLVTSGLIAAVFLGAVLAGGSGEDTGVVADPLEGGYGVGPEVAPGMRTTSVP